MGILSWNLCKFKRNVMPIAAKDVGKSVSLCTTVGNVENLTFFGVQERNRKYLLKFVDTLALNLELSSEELKIHREAYSCFVERGKTLKQSDNILVEMKVSVAQSCPNSLQSWTGIHQGPLPWNSPGKNIGVGSCSLLQGIFPTQGSNLRLLLCRQILYHWATEKTPW